MLNTIIAMQLKRIYLYLLLITLTFFAYLELSRNKFIDLYDDFDYIIDNRNIQNGIKCNTIKWAFFSFHSSNWHPLTWVSHTVDFQLFGLNPAGHHFTSFLIHIVNTLLVFTFFFKTTSSKWKSFLIALFFGIHPLHVESVAWVSERKDVLSTFFLFITLIFYYRYSKRKSIVTYILTIIFFICAILSKPIAVSLPLILLIIDYYPLKRYNTQKIFHVQNRNILLEKIPFITLSLFLSVITIFAQKSESAIIPISSIPVKMRLSNSILSFWIYIYKTFIPVKLGAFYPYPDSFSLIQIFAILGLFILITIISILKMNKLPFLFTGWFWFIIMLFPVIGIIQVGSQAMADRYMYISQTGLFIIIIWYIEKINLHDRIKKWLLPSLSIIFIIILLIITKIQVKYWYDTETLFRHTLNVTKKNFPAHYLLGMALNEKGKYNEAISHFKAADKINPGSPMILNSMALAYNNCGKTGNAISINRNILKIDPDNIKSLNNLGSIYLNLGKIDSAEIFLKTALSLNNKYWQIYYNLGIINFKKKEYNRAEEYLKTSIELHPLYYLSYYHIAKLYFLQGQNRKAIENINKCISIKPGFTDAHSLLSKISRKNNIKAIQNNKTEQNFNSP